MKARKGFKNGLEAAYKTAKDVEKVVIKPVGNAGLITVAECFPVAVKTAIHTYAAEAMPIVEGLLV